ncbi:MAG: UDP-2,4-diacetamido-2,4,6-trideoxy-beta-L-altropyranose hydrolase, partial [Gammaproteobacteria bacterium]|nr:UDP-2,4-diacetamido-2,4,6-trideoxy-beta-L-altropyranose hydrolase [Gammaproteobacteria bacterium]
MAEHPLRIAFRVDASSRIGSGHFMRCLTLADALTTRGAQIRFISRNLPIYLRNILDARGYMFAMLDGGSAESSIENLQHSHWLETSQASDAANTMQKLSDGVWDWVVVDHYALDVRWESVLRQMVKNIFVIDDLADRKHDCDILLDQNFYPDMFSRYGGKVPAQCRQLLGSRYLLLREEFRQQRKLVRTRGGRVERLLVVFGGADATNNTGRVLEALANFDYVFQYVDVVIGAQHPFGKQIAAACMKQGYIFHRQTNRMAEL